jgi:hypothetical protein
MPNWCQNSLVITAKNNIIEEIKDAEISLQKLFPCPEELRNTTAPAQYNDKEKAVTNLEKYGHEDWYSWQVSNWGTKWDIGPISEDSMDISDNQDGTSTLNCVFDSAWSPPVEAFKSLFNKYNKVDSNIYIRLEYFEPGCAFLGVAHTTDDKNFIDESYDYENSEDLEAYVNDLEHDLALSEVDYLREREEEERQYNLEQEKNSENKKKLNKATKKTANKSGTKKPVKKLKVKEPSKKSSKKAAAKITAKKPSKKSKSKKNISKTTKK